MQVDYSIHSHKIYNRKPFIITIRISILLHHNKMFKFNRRPSSSRKGYVQLNENDNHPRNKKFRLMKTTNNTITAADETDTTASLLSLSSSSSSSSSSSLFGREIETTKESSSSYITTTIIAAQNYDDDNKTTTTTTTTTIVEVTAQEVAEAEVAIKHVLSLNADIVSRVIQYLPPKQQHRTCTLVSKLWNTVIVTNGGCSTLTLRIEDVVIITNINKNKKKTDDDEDKEEEEEDDEMRMIRIPLHSIGRLPSYVTTKTTKLILVLKLSKEHESKYNLNDFMFDGKSNNKQIYFLDRFPILQDLIIYSEFALDQYVSILSTNPKNNGIATLKSIVYEETNVSNWRQSNLQAFVKLAPNLESLILRENMYWKWNNDGRFLQQDSLQELLPLRNSLRKLVLFNRLNIVIDNDNSFNSFISQMPLLKSWDLSCNNPTNTSIPIIVLTTPTTTTTTNNINNDDNNNSTINKNMKQQTYDDNSYRGYDLNDRNKHYYKYVEEEVEFIIIMQDVIVRWYIELHDIHTHPWGDGTRNHILLMIRYLDALVHEFFGNSQYIFDEERPNRPYILPSLQNLLLETTSTAGGGGGGGGGGGTLYPKYCSSYSRNKIILHNYHQVVKPCIQIYHKEFKLYLEGNGFGYKYNTCQKLHQRYQLWRLTKRISHVYDYNRSIIMIRRSRKYRNTGFTVLV